MRPRIAITMGDPAGIGPEIVVKALSRPEIYDICQPVVLGAKAILSQTAATLGIKIAIHDRRAVAEAQDQAGTMDVICPNYLQPQDIALGEVSAIAGRAAMDYVMAGLGLAEKGEVAALVTAPINKEAIARAGFPDAGHMDFFARVTNTQRHATMLVSGPLRVVHLTTHRSLKEACLAVTKEAVLDKVELIVESFKGWGWERLRLAIAALNPHAGEGGLLGLEETREIAPAVAAARLKGLEVQGPFPADSVFLRALNGEFDVVLAMYHDQGHIPIKIYGFEKSVSVALGLPFIRTSVDHGTAFDIAGQGIANPTSLLEAIKVAVGLAQGKGLLALSRR